MKILDPPLPRRVSGLPLLGRPGGQIPLQGGHALDLLEIGELGTSVTSAFARVPSHAVLCAHSRLKIHAARSCRSRAYLQVKICDLRIYVGTYL